MDLLEAAAHGPDTRQAKEGGPLQGQGQRGYTVRSSLVRATQPDPVSLLSLLR